MRMHTYKYSRMSLSVKHLETVLKLLAEPNRLRIVYSLGLDCRPVTQIVKDTGLSQTNVSFHLRLLREAGLVRPRTKLKGAEVRQKLETRSHTKRSKHATT